MLVVRFNSSQITLNFSAVVFRFDSILFYSPLKNTKISRLKRISPFTLKRYFLISNREDVVL